MSSRHHARASSLAGLVLAAITIAACSAGGGSSAAALASAGPPSSPIVSSAPGGGAASGAAIDVCALLPVDQVATITKTTISGSTSRPSGLVANDSGCTYGTSAVLVDVVTPGGAAAYAAQVAQYGSNVEPIAGFGDKAFQDLTDGTGLVALFGDTEFDVFITDRSGGDSEADINSESEALISALQAKL